MVQEYEKVSQRLRESGLRWVRGAKMMDSLAGELQASGDLPPSMLDALGDERIFSHPDFDFDRGERLVTLKGCNKLEAVRLTRTEFLLLDLLCRNLDRPLAKRQIVEDVWGTAYIEADSHRIAVHMLGLRCKLGGNNGSGRYRGIKAVWGKGYILKSSSTRQQAE